MTKIIFQIKKLLSLKLDYLYGAKNDGFVSSSSHLSNVSNRLLEIKVTQMYFDVSIRRNYTHKSLDLQSIFQCKYYLIQTFTKFIS